MIGRWSGAAWMDLPFNPYDRSFGESLTIVFERVTAQPASILAFFLWMLIFASLGGRPNEMP